METAVIARRSRLSSPRAIDEDLTALWLEVGRDAPVARALMANLIVLHEGADTRELGIPLDEVIRRHPSRVIVLRYTRGQAPAPIAHASVGIVTFGPPQARYGVEEIAVRSTCADASLPSIVRRLTRGDVPTSVWWAEDFSRVPPIPSLMRLTRQLVYDSRRWRDVRAAVHALAPLLQDENAPLLADLNWRRLTSMRYAIVHAARTMLSESGALGAVVVRHRPGEGALAWLLVGWLAARLRWPEGALPVRVEDARRGDELLAVSFDGVMATMNASRVLVRAQRGGPPFHVAARQESEADAVVAELNTLTPDCCLNDAIAALASRL